MIPIHISDLNDREKRENDKQWKMVNWYRSRSFSATLFVPATLDSRLTNLIQASSDASTQGPRVRVMERNGPTTRSILQWKDPYAKTPCSNSANYIPCSAGKLGMYRENIIVYHCLHKLCRHSPRSSPHSTHWDSGTTQHHFHLYHHPVFKNMTGICTPGDQNTWLPSRGRILYLYSGNTVC